MVRRKRIRRDNDRVREVVEQERTEEKDVLDKRNKRKCCEEERENWKMMRGKQRRMDGKKRGEKNMGRRVVKKDEKGKKSRTGWRRQKKKCEEEKESWKRTKTEKRRIGWKRTKKKDGKRREEKRERWVERAKPKQ